MYHIYRVYKAAWYPRGECFIKRGTVVLLARGVLCSSSPRFSFPRLFPPEEELWTGRGETRAKEDTEWKTITFSFTGSEALPRYKRARLHDKTKATSLSTRRASSRVVLPSSLSARRGRDNPVISSVLLHIYMYPARIKISVFCCRKLREMQPDGWKGEGKKGRRQLQEIRCLRL